MIVKVLTRRLSARGEGISNESNRTAAHRVVSNNITPSIDTTHSYTGVGTLEVDTSLVWRTFTIDDTLGSTIRWSSIVS